MMTGLTIPLLRRLRAGEDEEGGVAEGEERPPIGRHVVEEAGEVVDREGKQLWLSPMAIKTFKTRSLEPALNDRGNQIKSKFYPLEVFILM